MKIVRHGIVSGYIGRRIEIDNFIDYIFNFSQQFYICKKNEFVKSIFGYLENVAANNNSIFIGM